MACSSCGGGSSTNSSYQYSYASTQTGSGGCGSCSGSTDCGSACGCDECSTGTKCCPDLGTGSDSCDPMRKYNNTKIKELFCFITKLNPCTHLQKFLSKAFGRIWCLLNNIINNICALWDDINTLRGVPEDDLHDNWYKATVAQGEFVSLGENLWQSKSQRPKHFLIPIDDFDEIHTIVGQALNTDSFVEIVTQEPILKGLHYVVRYEVFTKTDTPNELEIGFAVLGMKNKEVI